LRTEKTFANDIRNQQQRKQVKCRNGGGRKQQLRLIAFYWIIIQPL